MSFLDTIGKAKTYLHEHTRVSLRALQREFDLDEAALEELVEELVDIQQVARRNGKALEWAGPAEPASASQPLTPNTLTPNTLPSEAERRQLTVMFCDLVSSTQLASRLDAEEWREIMAQYQHAAASAVTRWGGHVAKQLGDGVLVYFGWPTAREDDPERAVRAGLEVIEAVRRLAVTRLGEDGPANLADPLTANRLSVRVGLHTGPVVIGEDGEVFGETANVAARVQGAAAPDTVVITAATQRLVAGMFRVESRGPQPLKGVREPVALYRVVQPTGVRSRLDVAAGRLTPFVGREVELATLVERWERSEEGQGQTVLVTGEAGVGKSRLVYRLRERLKAVPHTWLECSCAPYTRDTAFHPVIALLQQGLVFEPSDTAAQKHERLERGLRLVGLGEQPEALALMAAFLGLPPPAGQAPLGMSPELQRRETMEVLLAWNLALSEIQPLVLAVEDLHWADASSLELIGRLVAQNATARVLVVATARPEFTAPWPSRSHLTTLQLERLTRRQAREMVGALSAQAQLAVETVEAIVARADGVPLYVEELTKAVAEPGAARGAGAIPATLQDSLMARLDRLSAAKEVAQRAAVLGREFPYALLAATAGVEEAALQRSLAQLVEAEILFARGAPPQATYTFKHALVQEAAYESLLKRTRQELHGRVVAVLVLEPEADAEVVARHAEAAGLAEEAVTYYERAGEQAQARSAHAEAIEQLQRAIGLLATLPEGSARDRREATLQLALGTSLTAVRSFSHPETGATYERARVLCERTGEDAGDLARALLGLSVFHQSYDQRRAIALAERAMTIAEETRDDVILVMAHLRAGIPRYQRGECTAALEHFMRVLDAYARMPRQCWPTANDPGVAAHAYAGWVLWQLGYPERAQEHGRAAVHVGRQVRHPFSLGQALVFEVHLHYLCGDFSAQRGRAAEAIALGDSQGFPLWAGGGRVGHGAAGVASGEGAAAAAEVLEGLALASGTGNQTGAPAILAYVAQARHALGEHAEALATLDVALAVAAQTDQHFYDAELHRVKGELILAATPHNQGEGEALFQQALAIARAQECRGFELRTAISLVRLWQRQRRQAEARTLLQPIYEWFTEGFDTQDLRGAKALLEELG